MATAGQLVQPKRATVNERKRRRFLDYVRDGYAITKAAEAAKIPRQTLYDWRKADQDFAHEWDDAYEQGCDALEEVAQNRAIDKSDLMLIFLMKGRRPQRYRDNVKHESDIRVTVDVADARLELARRFGMIEDHRAQAIDGTSRELPASSSSSDPATDVA